MKVISLNLNGIRAAGRKGFYAWMAAQSPDIVCLQETKAQMAHLTDELYYPAGYHHYFADAEKKGYSGVGIYCREAPVQVHTKLGWPVADSEGRYVQVDFPRFTVVSLYLPSGSSGEVRQAVKFEFLTYFREHLHALYAKGKPVIVCGDWNIAHTKKDIKNWRGNQKNSGFLPEERAWLEEIFVSGEFVDAFRVLNQDEDQYTWWSNRGQAWANNVGWRIDYQLITPTLVDTLQAVSIYKDQRFSDHAPLIMQYDY